MEWIEALLAWVAVRAVELAAAWTVAVVIGSVLLGGRYKKRLAALENRPSVVVNVERSGQRPGRPPNFEPAAAPAAIPFAELGSRIADFTSGEEWTHASIWELHAVLGEHGIPWPGPGIDPPFRRAVSEELLAACRAGDMDRARAAWATAKGRRQGKSSV